tara:strand:+ start:330 stop:575 length:246 start_codon:yes stop_codon:yes gene_type:complete
LGENASQQMQEELREQSLFAQYDHKSDYFRDGSQGNSDYDDGGKHRPYRDAIINEQTPCVTTVSLRKKANRHLLKKRQKFH